MSSPSSSSEQSDFNYTHSPTGPLSLGDSSDSDKSLNFYPFDYILPSNNTAYNPTLHEEDQIFLVPGEDLISLSLYEDIPDKSMSSNVEGALSSNMSSGGSFLIRIGGKTKYRQPILAITRQPKLPSKRGGK